MKQLPQLTWMDKKGAGHVRPIPNAAECERLMRSLRTTATLRQGDDVIGRVERHPENEHRWMWWFDQTAW